jgi:hypothetical protein
MATAAAMAHTRAMGRSTTLAELKEDGGAALSYARCTKFWSPWLPEGRQRRTKLWLKNIFSRWEVYRQRALGRWRARY